MKNKSQNLKNLLEDLGPVESKDAQNEWLLQQMLKDSSSRPFHEAPVGYEQNLLKTLDKKLHFTDPKTLEHKKVWATSILKNPLMTWMLLASFCVIAVSVWFLRTPSTVNFNAPINLVKQDPPSKKDEKDLVSQVAAQSDHLVVKDWVQSMVASEDQFGNFEKMDADIMDQAFEDVTREMGQKM